jgi:hypothetical protein
MLTGVLFNLCEGLINFNVWGGEDLRHSISFLVLFFKVTFFCHATSNEARSSRVVVENLLLEGNGGNECIEELKMFSLQLQAMKTEYTACGFFSLNLNLFTSVVSVIASYVVALVQIK